jgi:hypothetical protein
MSASLANEQDARPAVVYDSEGSPCLELSADELIYPIQSDDESYHMLVVMRPYMAHKLWAFYDKILPRKKAISGSEQEYVTPDFAELESFISEHFIRFAGVLTKGGVISEIRLEGGDAPTAEIERKWLDQNPIFKRQIFRKGLDAIAPRRKMEAPSGDIVLFIGRVDQQIGTSMQLFSMEKKRIERIEMTHTIEKMTESERHQYDSAISLIENVKSRESYSSANWSVVEKMYNRKAKSVTGALLNGEPCTHANRDGRDGWAEKIPMVDKIYILAQAFGKIEMGNA